MPLISTGVSGTQHSYHTGRISFVMYFHFPSHLFTSFSEEEKCILIWWFFARGHTLFGYIPIQQSHRDVKRVIGSYLKTFSLSLTESVNIYTYLLLCYVYSEWHIIFYHIKTKFPVLLHHFDFFMCLKYKIKKKKKSNCKF